MLVNRKIIKKYVSDIPSLAESWSRAENKARGLFASSTTAQSNKKAVWVCLKGHRWEAAVYNRFKGKGCPYCSGRRALPETCLAAISPQLASEWHPTRNLNLTPSDVTKGSERDVWWRCSEGHEWLAIVANRYAGSRCPYCFKRVPPEKVCLASVNPQLAFEWHPTKNRQRVTPTTVTACSNKRVWWRCSVGHEWEDVVSNRVKDSSCPLCTGREVCVDNYLITANPLLAAQWHPTKNQGLTPATVAPYSNKKAWWRCSAGHEWQALVANRFKGSGCPYCAGFRVYIDNCLATLSPCLSAEWHPTKNGSLTPFIVTKSAKKKIWWLCSRGHEWVATINARQSGNGCPYCSGKRVCKDNCLAAVNPSLAAEWHSVKNGNLTPEMVTPGSDKRVWWRCVNEHEWETAVCSRSRGSGCPQCVRGSISKASQQWLDSLGIPEEYREFAIKLPGRKRPLHVDGFDPTTNTVYEFLGDFWHGNPEVYESKAVNRVNKKTFGALYNQTMRRLDRLRKAGYTVVFIWEKDFNINISDLSVKIP